MIRGEPPGHCTSSDVVVIGAGLGGLAAALALQRAGRRVRLFEQARVLGEVGAGISLSPGACRGLASLGVGEPLLEASAPAAHVAFVDYRTGALLAGMRGDSVADDHGFDTARHIHRADLHRILLDAVMRNDAATVVLDRKLVALELIEMGARARFADGSAIETELLIAADGTRSVVRTALFDAAAPVFAGQVAYRCLVPGAIAAPFLGGGRAVVSVGGGRIFHRYPIRGGALVNVVGIARTDGWQREGWNVPATRDEFGCAYADFHPDVTGLIGVAPEASLIKWGLFVHPPLAGWIKGRVALLGDAAHPILPFLGLGAALAIEDALVLARALDGTATIERALAAYQSARLDRVERVRVQTIAQGKIIQSTDPALAGITSAPSQDRALFDYDPLTARLSV